MVALWTGKRLGPIGIDLGSRSVKLVQLSRDGTQLIEAARADLPLGFGASQGAADFKPEKESSSSIGCSNLTKELSKALRQAREGRKFRGREVVLCLGPRELYVQNMRVPKGPPAELEHVIRQEAEPRLPFPANEAELRFLEAADVRQGDMTRREVIVLACHRPVLDQILQVVDDAKLTPVAIEVEPAALLRCYGLQFRRDADQAQRAIFVHLGNASTAVVIAQGTEVLFIKYIDLAGRHFDEAVARHLKMEVSEAWALRRHNGDRRADQQDPEVARSVAESLRPAIDRLANEILLCIRYHSVTFRGQQLKRLVLGGGEATQTLLDSLAARIDMKCELGDPLRAFDAASVPGRKAQWDVALGLALRPMS
jgi:type IV pilus assembly protein PilM